MYRPTLRQLSFLLALYEHKNFSRAAEASFVTQSTLSAAIQDLEAGLGETLVERTKRVVHFTDLGEQAVAQAQVVLGETDKLMDLVKGAGKPLCGEIRLGAIPTIGPYVLPAALPGLGKKYPKLKLFLREGQSADTLANLKSGALDAGLIAFPYPTPGLAVEMVSDERFFLVCKNDHPMASKTEIDIKSVDPKELLLLEEGHCLRNHALSLCDFQNLNSGDQFKATSLETLILMVAAGLGLTLVPEMAIKAGILKGRGLTAIALKDAPMGRGIGLCWRKANPRAEEFKLLAKELSTLLAA